jgi:very-short-patch-repair endonuclease
MPDDEQPRLRPPPALWEKLRPLVREKRHAPTPAERALWERLRRNQIKGAHFRRQHAIERFIVDFYCPEAQLVIEIDGPVHDYTPAEDAVRQEFLESLGLRVMRFASDEVQAGINRMIRRIEDAVAD